MRLQLDPSNADYNDNTSGEIFVRGFSRNGKAARLHRDMVWSDIASSVDEIPTHRSDTLQRIATVHNPDERITRGTYIADLYLSCTFMTA